MLCLSGLSSSGSGLICCVTEHCDNYATEFDIMSTDSKNKLLFFRGREFTFTTQAKEIHVNKQLVYLINR